MELHQEPCPLCGATADLADLPREASYKVVCPTCTTFLVTYVLLDRLTRGDANELMVADVAGLKRALSENLKNYLSETKQPFHLTEGNYGAIAGSKSRAEGVE